MHRRHSCSLLRKLFLEEQSSHFWKIMVAADPKSWPWTPANVFLTPKCPAKTKQLHSWQDLSCYLLGMTIIYSPQCPWGSPRDHTVALGACQWVISGLRPFSHLPSQENTDPCWRRVDIAIRSCFHCNCVFLLSFQVSTGSLTGPFGVLTGDLQFFSQVLVLDSRWPWPKLPLWKTSYLALKTGRPSPSKRCMCLIFLKCHSRLDCSF